MFDPDLDFIIRPEIKVRVDINWKRIYDFLKENPDISLEGFVNNMISIWELEDPNNRLVEIYSYELKDYKQASNLINK